MKDPRDVLRRIAFIRGVQLRTLHDTLHGCIGCGCLSIDRCRLRMAAKGPGPQCLWVKP